MNTTTFVIYINCLSPSEHRKIMLGIDEISAGHVLGEYFEFLDVRGLSILELNFEEWLLSQDNYTQLDTSTKVYYRTFDLEEAVMLHEIVG